ncbi:hypothetical protein [Salipaludibacillus sp. CF4.18]|uniref:hypothetical protein n=1 Tax=Salipaludibacillus sp. CF4.18 TaxID=3373081 RepID=UPI003EE4D046
MCGINGMMFFNEQEVCRASLHNMGNQMVHRGPGEEDIWVGEMSDWAFVGYQLLTWNMRSNQ